MIKKCKCKHPFQDARYGAGKRVHNKSKGIRKEIAWTCTVCNTKKEGD